MRLEAALDRLFPFAGAIDVTVPLADDGSFLAELVLPAKVGQTRLQLCRVPAGSDEGPWEDQFRWRGAGHRFSDGAGRWAFLAAWDGVASIDEVRALVMSRLVRDPQLGDPEVDRAPLEEG